MRGGLDQKKGPKGPLFMHRNLGSLRSVERVELLVLDIRARLALPAGLQEWALVRLYVFRVLRIRAEWALKRDAVRGVVAHVLGRDDLGGRDAVLAPRGQRAEHVV